MFWAHDKFGNGFDVTDGSGWPDYPAELVWPDYPVELVWPDDPNKPDRLENPNRLGRPDDSDKPNNSYLSVVPVKFVNMAQHDLAQLNSSGSLAQLGPLGHQAHSTHLGRRPAQRYGLSGLINLFELSISFDAFVSSCRCDPSSYD